MELNRLAPDFELRDINGQPRRTGDYHGRIVIVNFWSTECIQPYGKFDRIKP